MAAVAFADVHKKRRKPVQFASQEIGQHEALALAHQIREIFALARELQAKPAQGLFPFGIDKQPAHEVQKIVAAYESNGKNRSPEPVSNREFEGRLCN